jgi:hypothetical protein
MSSLKKLVPVLSIIVLILSCNKDPQDIKLQKQWMATHIDSGSGDEIESTIFFVHDGTVTFNRSLKNWSGKWNTNNGTLSISFENETITGTYDYKVKNNRASPVGTRLPFEVLTLEPITIDDSLDLNQFKGEYNSLY